MAEGVYRFAPDGRTGGVNGPPVFRGLPDDRGDLAGASSVEKVKVREGGRGPVLRRVAATSSKKKGVLPEGRERSLQFLRRQEDGLPGGGDMRPTPR